MCLALALWNGRDPILKERLFGLTGNEGNHGEDVKEYYFYLDSTPTHRFMRMLYKYPQAAFPYAALVDENRRRGRDAPEFELIDTGVFDGDRYFDVIVEYAKADAEDLLMRITATSIADRKRRRSMCCRPSGSATRGRGTAITQAVLALERRRSADGTRRLTRGHAALRPRAGSTSTARRNCSSPKTTRTCERLFGVEPPPASPVFAKDGINDYVVHGARDA